MYKLLSVLALVTLPGTAVATPSINTSTKQVKPSAQKYCLQMDPNTGSRIRTTECRTKAEWKDLGVDVDALLSEAGQTDSKA